MDIFATKSLASLSKVRPALEYKNNISYEVSIK